MPWQLLRLAFERHDDDCEHDYSSQRPQHQQKLQDPNSYYNHNDVAYFVDAAFVSVVHVVAELGIDLNGAVDNTVVAVFQGLGN